jgi:ABC-type lipoprotein export system ATPase subunit
MPFTKLNITRFGAFTDAQLDLLPGVNVLIGENGSGKSQVLKLLYVLHEVARKTWHPDIAVDSKSELTELLNETFLPDEEALGRLVRRTGKGVKTAEVGATYGDASISFSLTHKGRLSVNCPKDPLDDSRSNDFPAIFLPSREVLSVARVFVGDLRGRKTGFDRTYFDLAEMLYRSPLKGRRDDGREKLLKPLEKALGGAVKERGGQFYVQIADGDIEMPLLAEGLRKIAQLVYLVVNGSLQKRGILLWDEPEANLGAGYAQLLASTILGLAQQGIQIVIATHDYVLASELSRQIEQAPQKLPACAFFALRRGDDGQRQVERAEAFALLQTNPILDALADLHDRELSGVERSR